MAFSPNVLLAFIIDHTRFDTSTLLFHIHFLLNSYHYPLMRLGMRPPNRQFCSFQSFLHLLIFPPSIPQADIPTLWNHPQTPPKHHIYHQPLLAVRRRPTEGPKWAIKPPLCSLHTHSSVPLPVSWPSPLPVHITTTTDLLIYHLNTPPPSVNHNKGITSNNLVAVWISGCWQSSFTATSRCQYSPLPPENSQ